MKLANGLALDNRAGKIILGLLLPVLVVVLWQIAGPNGSLFGGVLPTPDRVWKAWKIWAFGPAGMGLNPYSGTWLDNALFSTERVAKGLAPQYWSGSRSASRSAGAGWQPARSIRPSSCCARSRSRPGCRFPSPCSASATWARCS